LDYADRTPPLRALVLVVVRREPVRNEPDGHRHGEKPRVAVQSQPAFRKNSSMKTTTDNHTTSNNTPVKTSVTVENRPSEPASQFSRKPSGGKPEVGRYFTSGENVTRQHLDFGDLIFDYTRAHAISCGVLVDVSELARDAGFRFPIAMTESAWETCVRVPDMVEGQDEIGRLWDVLMVLRFSIALASVPCNETQFTVAVRQEGDRAVDVDLKALCHPGDQAEPVITILLPHEDCRTTLLLNE